jgi:hypothetical protein
MESRDEIVPKRLCLKEQPSTAVTFNLRQLVAQELFKRLARGKDPDAVLETHGASGAQMTPELYTRAGGMSGQLGYEEKPDKFIHIASRKVVLQHVLHSYHGTLVMDLQHVLQHVWAILSDFTRERSA